jgi:hypothetical protein
VFVPCGQKVNGQFYLEVMKRLREVEQRKRPDRWRTKTRMAHHDNTPAHISLLVHEFLAKHKTTVILQMPYSLDFAPADFFLFPKLISTPKVFRFRTIEENSLWDLCSVLQNTFQDTFQNWKIMLEAVYIISKCFKRNFGLFWTGHTCTKCKSYVQINL